MTKTFFVKSMEKLNVNSTVLLKLESLRDSISKAFSDTAVEILDREKSEDDRPVLFQDIFLYEVSVEEEKLEELKKKLEDAAEDEDVNTDIEVTIAFELTEADLDADIRRNIGVYTDGRSYLKIAAADRDYGLDILVDDTDPIVRAHVAARGYKPEEMVKDKSSKVRIEVAKLLYANRVINNLPVDALVQILVKDESPSVKAALARAGYCHDILIKDESAEVRIASATTAEEFALLVDDEDSSVRVYAAENGYGHNKLMNDLAREVRETVAEKTTDNEIAEVLARDESDHVKEATARRKDINIMKILLEKDDEGKYKNNGFVRAEVAKNAADMPKIMDELAKDEIWQVRAEIAKLGYQSLLKDSRAEVRKAAYDALNVE